jgi:hypothetical protein
LTIAIDLTYNLKCEQIFKMPFASKFNHKVLAVTWNREDELTFFNELRKELNRLDFELVLIGYGHPNKIVNVPQILSFYGLDIDIFNEFKIGIEQQSFIEFSTTGHLDDDRLLEIERLWNGIEQNKAHLDNRKNALYFYKNFYASILQLIKPSLTIIWNGQHTQEIILDQLCRQCNCPVLYLERGPFKGTLQISPDGCTANTKIAQAKSWSWPENEDIEKWLQCMTSLELKYRQNHTTWYSVEQPHKVSLSELRDRLKIPEDKKILLFTGQLDNDTSNFLHSPNFGDNISAFKWLCDVLRGRNDIFILGKHHPLNQHPINGFRDAVKGLGIWVDDVSLENCFSLADRVATVNSTTLFEALMLDKPVLTLGKSLITNKDIAYEISNLAQADQILDDWLFAKDLKIKKERWLDFGAYLLSEELYFMDDYYALPSYRKACSMASKIVHRVQALDSTYQYSNIRLDPFFMLKTTSFEFLNSVQSLYKANKHVEQNFCSIKKTIAQRIYSRISSALQSFRSFF